ncbi:hypothetical protein IAD21_03974 [Abditibacteriota bacterium]|nr:hypothetical protein IAD21_03974 [Abditibacteriota bacterium]
MTNTNTGSRVSALFDTRAQAEAAVNAIRAQGVSEAHFSVITRQGDGTAVAHDDAGDDVAKGTLAGVGVGALFGIAAALIPGVGPFITAGTLLSTALGAVGGGAVAGAVVGGTTGLVASALARAGYDEREANYYGSALEQGGTLVTVDTGDLNAAAVQQILSQHGGRTAVGAL